MQDDSIKPEELERVVVIGSSCTGKTTFSKKLSKHLNCKHIEVDWLNWLPDWQERPNEEFRALVKKETSADRWVLDGNYSRVRDITWNRATHIIWLNYSFPIVFYRAIKRTTRRAFTKEEICNGNQESIRQSFFSTDSMIVWVIRTYHSRRRRYKEQVKKKQYGNAKFIVLNNSQEADNFLATFHV